MVVRDEGVLSRWSRRKGKAIEPANVDLPAEDGKTAITPIEGRATERPNEKTDADMPAVESLDESSDYSQFLSPKVSQKLRSVALRKLFHTTGFNIRDGLDDYDDDFTLFEPLGDTITADMRHHMEREKEKERQRLAKLADDESSKELTESSSDDDEEAKLGPVDNKDVEDGSITAAETDDNDGERGLGHASENKT